MATLAQAVAEKDRLMRLYPGVTARVTVLSSAFGVSVHDVRASEVKTTGQKAVLGGGVLDIGARIGWSAAFEPASTQAVYT